MTVFTFFDNYVHDTILLSMQSVLSHIKTDSKMDLVILTKKQVPKKILLALSKLFISVETKHPSNYDVLRKENLDFITHPFIVDVIGENYDIDRLWVDSRLILTSDFHIDHQSNKNLFVRLANNLISSHLLYLKKSQSFPQVAKLLKISNLCDPSINIVFTTAITSNFLIEKDIYSAKTIKSGSSLPNSIIESSPDTLISDYLGIHLIQMVGPNYSKITAALHEKYDFSNKPKSLIQIVNSKLSNIHTSLFPSQNDKADETIEIKPERSTFIEEIEEPINENQVELDEDFGPVFYNSERYDFCIVITTYNRELMLKCLLNDIFKNKKYKIHVVIFDDGSQEKYDLSGYSVKYIKYIKNNGLKRVWSVITDTFKYCKNINAEYFVYLQDDLRLKPKFFEESVRIFNSIPDENKITLGTLMIESQRNKPKWTDFMPIEYIDYYKTQWCELVFICKYEFFEELDFRIIEIPESRWRKNPNISCGVGEQISHRLLEKGLNMYHVTESLTIHGDHESRFLPDLRKIEKLIAK